MNSDSSDQPPGEILAVFPNTEAISMNSKRSEPCLKSCQNIVVDEQERLKRVNPAHDLATTSAAKWRHAVAARK